MFYGRFVEPVEIGAGAFGTVYQALEPKAGRSVALKESACGRSSSAALRIQEMKREYELIKQLKHDNIVTVFDFLTGDDGYVVISMELASGGSLRDLLRKNKFRLYESTIRNYALGALSGLEYLHAKGVLHCDIKPENLVLCGSTVKLCDFGLSKQCLGSSADGHHTANINGTPRYMAPELWDTNTYTQASDIWALGCTLAELATGSRPWEGSIRPDAHHYAVMFFVHGLLANPAAYDPSKVVPGHLTHTLRTMLEGMLRLDATKRPTATECLQSLYFAHGDSWRDDEGIESEDYYDALLCEIHTHPPRELASSSPDVVSPKDRRSQGFLGEETDGATRISSATTDFGVSEQSRRKVTTRSSVSASWSVSQAPQGDQPRRRAAAATSSCKKATDVKKSISRDEEAGRPLTTTSTALKVESFPECKALPLRATDAFLWVFQNGRRPCPYDADAQIAIEAAYQSKQETVVITTIRMLDALPGQYEIDFIKMRQRNTKTNYLRKVERRVQ
jgi:serine/threonine protein kinase